MQDAEDEGVGSVNWKRHIPRVQISGSNGIMCARLKAQTKCQEK